MRTSAVLVLCVIALSLVQLVFPQTVVPLRARQTSLLSRRTLKGQPIHLTGNLTFWGEYFAPVGLGTPPQYLNLQIDTGIHPETQPRHFPPPPRTDSTNQRGL